MLKNKLSSRKFWAAAAGFVCSCAVAFGCPENTVTQISAVLAAAGVVIAYIFGESYVDANK